MKFTNFKISRESIFSIESVAHVRLCKTFYHISVNFRKPQNRFLFSEQVRPYHITCLISNGDILLKRPDFSLIMAPRGSECQTSYRKSWPGNHFQALNLTSDPCFKGVIILKRPYISHIIVLRASECENSPWKALACKLFVCEKFRSHFEKQNGRHSRLFENH